jgi:hypothetical protein
MENSNQPPLDKPQLPEAGSAHSNLSKKLLIVIGLIVLFFVISGMSYYLVSNKNNSSIKNTNATQPEVTLSSIPSIDQKEVLSSLEKALQVTAPLTERNNVDWFDQNKQRVPLIGQNFVLGTEANAYMGKYGSYLAGNIYAITEESFKPLQSSIDSFFLTNGFQKDDQNTFRSTGQIYLSTGYVKGDLKCLITLTPQTDPFGSFFCGKADQTQLAWRKELSPAINTTNEPSLVVTVKKLSGNYAAGGIGSSLSGAVWYAVKIDGQWKKVWTGQNNISCNLVNQYTIPKEIYGNECSTAY